MNVPGIEVATFFQQIFEPPVVLVRKEATEETQGLQEATAEASRSSSSGVHGTMRDWAGGISVKKPKNGEVREGEGVVPGYSPRMPTKI